MNARISSPIATGGAGTFFERDVDAYWLALLLVRAMPPMLLDCAVTEVHLQTERLGWNTDDFLVVGEQDSGSRRLLAGQIKRTFTVSAADEDCVKTILDFWKDFKAPGRLSPGVDRLVLAVQRGTHALLGDFVGLIDCAEASRDAAEFERRLRTHGLLSAKSVANCRQLQEIVGRHEGTALAAGDIWPFLRALRVIHLDLQTSTRQHEALIKTLLRHTAAEADIANAADATWSALLDLAEQGMTQARSFRFSDLPSALRIRHTRLGDLEGRSLRALADHARPILDGIRSTIGAGFHLTRAGLVQKVVDQLASHQVVLLSGPAGSGKSAVAKDALASLSSDYFTCGFRAEDLAQPHLNATLQHAQIPANIAAVQAALAAQDRKVIFVESVERLLEKTTREAFGDLLGLAAKDQSLQIVLTCRDYSANLVRDCFLLSAGVEHAVVAVPPLTDAELAEVKTVYPQLGRPLASGKLQSVLRNPYFLDKATTIDWTDPLVPVSEREFRALFWRQIIRDEAHAVAGMPQRREQAFQIIALRRARVLTVHVSSTDLDASVIDALVHDGLLTRSDTAPALVAPAHDVLEDWAILRWLETEHLANHGAFPALAMSVGAHPAIRRAYRTWVAELLELDSAAADRLFQAAVMNAETSAQFRDDTLVSLLRAPDAASFLARNSATLLANNLALFRRFIHLLRVACVKAPAWMPASRSLSSIFNVPDGSAWASVLRLVDQHHEAFEATDRRLLLGLIEDWARGVAFWAPYPDGAESAASIAFWLLPGYAAHRPESPGRRIMDVIAKIPLSSRDRFETLLRGRDIPGRERTAEEFRDVIFTGIDGMPAARDLPDLVIETALDYLLCDEEDLQDHRHFGSSGLGLELVFGINERLHHYYYPASALRGPWVQLLRSHPDKGIAFLIDVFHHSAEWYANPRVPDRIETPLETELTFADGTTRKQWISARLWNLYRGTAVGPEVLQSLLMALEHWLLDYAKTFPHQLDAMLVDILRRSDNAALTAVVASIATAFPAIAGETLLVLLSSRLCITLDRHRLASESSAPSGIGELFPTPAQQKAYAEERRQSDSLPHRHLDLEQIVARLQLGSLASRVEAILDRHRASLPPIAEQTDADRVWRLVLHRIDLRQYTATEVEGPAETTSGDTSEPAVPRRLFRLDPIEPDADVQEMVAASTTRFDAINARLRLLMWAHKIFRHEQDPAADPALWRDQLAAARAPGADDDPDPSAPDMTRGGPGNVAAVCIRDHWDEMDSGERSWCVRRACSEVMAHADHWDDMARIQRHEIAADRACAWVLPSLLGKSLESEELSIVRTAFVAALTHAIQQVRWYVTWGIATHLWSIDRTLTLRCVNALAVESEQVNREWRVEEARRYDQRRPMMSIMAESAAAIRTTFWETNGIATDAYGRLDITDWFGASANARVLAILSKVPNDPLAIAAFVRAAQTLVAWWESDDRNRGGHRDHDHDDETAISQRLQEVLLRTSADGARSIVAPLLEAVENHGRELHWLIRGLISVENGQPNTPQFWLIWDLFADRVRTADWLADLDDDYCAGDEVLSAVFLGASWNDHVRHWTSLEGYADHVHRLFEDLPATARVLDAYLRFLYHIGEQSLPAAFVRIDRRLRAGDAPKMLKEANTVFMLETLLVRNVYRKPLELKQDPAIRDAVLSLLDTLVENGSSAAFRMRDDFVTPIAAA